RVRGAEPHRAFRAADQYGQGTETDGGLSGIAPFGRQRASRQSRTVPADPGRGLAGGAARGQAVCERALVRALERADRQDAVLARARRVSRRYAITFALRRKPHTSTTGLPAKSRSR